MNALSRFFNRQAHVDRPVSESGFVVLDTELTGLDEKTDSIVSVGAVRMTGGSIRAGETFYRLTRPKAALTRASVVIHGITPSDVMEEGRIEDVLADLVEFVGGDVIVGHCVSIDMEFIGREMNKHMGKGLDNPAIDTLSLYGWAKKRGVMPEGGKSGPPDYRIYAIAGLLGVPVNGAHNALMDAYITAQVFQRFMPLLAQGGITQLDDLLKIGAPGKGGEYFGGSGGLQNF